MRFAALINVNGQAMDFRTAVQRRRSGKIEQISSVLYGSSYYVEIKKGYENRLKGSRECFNINPWSKILGIFVIGEVCLLFGAEIKPSRGHTDQGLYYIAKHSLTDG